jgi:hypothetical protein
VENNFRSGKTYREIFGWSGAWPKTWAQLASEGEDTPLQVRERAGLLHRLQNRQALYDRRAAKLARLQADIDQWEGQHR